MDLSPQDSASTRHSPISSMMTESTTSIPSIPYDYLPPIRTSSPLKLSKSKSVQNLKEFGPAPDMDVDRGHYIDPKNLQKPLPEVPCSIFDRLEMPMSFHPTRRAPLPPFMQSWIDLSDDDDDDSSTYKSSSPTSAPAPIHHRIEKEIMRMLQFNEEKEVERRIVEKKDTHRRSNLNLGGFMGKLRRSMSVRGSMEWKDPKRGSYIDYVG
jgi:hypothetical protein